MATLDPSDTAGAPKHRFARLVYDTRSQPLPVGVRAILQQSRKLLFAVDEVEVMLQVSPALSPGQLKLLGQVWSDGRPSRRAEVRLEGPLEVDDWVTDAAGQFRFRALPAGSYTIRIGTADQTVELPRLTLAAA